MVMVIVAGWLASLDRIGYQINLGWEKVKLTIGAYLGPFLSFFHSLTTNRIHNRHSIHHLISVGNVVFSEVLTLPNGMSKGCG